MEQSSQSLLLWAVYVVPVLVLYWLLTRKKVKQNQRNKALLAKARQQGVDQPASLHPLINDELCIGCKSCILACPEGDVLGLVDDKSRLINPTHCIGHGACARACPVGAIELVFGTEKRGVDIPFVSENFETNVPHIFIAGELGGMGLIANAVEQGQQAVTYIAKDKRPRADDWLDVLIVGAGPAGIAASLRARELGLASVTLEQESLGGTVSHFPRGKLVMTRPVNLPLHGKVRLRETRKEALLSLWQDVIDKHQPNIRYEEKLEQVESLRNGFRVRSSKAEYHTNAILLAIGRRGSPRKLGVPGEDLEKVVYRLIDPAQYLGKKVLVVGGGDSALEAAMALAEQPGTGVSLSYRSASFSRVKPANREKFSAMVETGLVKTYLSSNVQTITTDTVLLRDENDALLELDNDIVIINVGGELPTALLKSLGVQVETKFGTS